MEFRTVPMAVRVRLLTKSYCAFFATICRPTKTFAIPGMMLEVYSFIDISTLALM